MSSTRFRHFLAAGPFFIACGSDYRADEELLAPQWAALTVNGVDANVALQSDWGSGYCADVTIRNGSTSAIRDWNVTLQLRQGTISNVWNGTRTGSTVTPVAHNAVVNPGQTVNFGFCANATGSDYLPSVSALTFQRVNGGGTGGSGGTAGSGGTGGTATGGTGGTNTGGTGGVATGGTGGIATGGTGGNTGGTGGVSTGGTGGVATGGTGGVATGGTGGRTSGGSNSGGTSTGGTTSGSATLRIDNDWGSGYCATVTPAASSSWRVELEMNRSEINNLWNGSFTTSGSRVTVTGTASSFGFCARSLATTNYRATVVGSSTGTGGGTSTGGTGGTSTGGSGGTGGSSGSGGSAGSGGSGGNTGYPPIQNGCSGYATRFWDCCKPHCGWSGNVPSGVNPMRSCSAQDQPLASYDAQSACSGGNAHTCQGLTPIEINDNLSYGYAATSSGDVCGRCYQLQFTGSSHNAGNDPGSRALQGKTMIVQAINIGYDVGGGQFDLLVPGGGVGAFNACSAQWGVSNSELGAQYGGFLSACKSQLGSSNHAALKSCVVNRCDSVFGSRGLTEMQQGCHWFADWFEAADNPALKYKEVACPAALTGESGMNRSGRNDISNACGN